MMSFASSIPILRTVLLHYIDLYHCFWNAQCFCDPHPLNAHVSSRVLQRLRAYSNCGLPLALSGCFARDETYSGYEINARMSPKNGCNLRSVPTRGL
jgi:hypothetical protein